MFSSNTQNKNKGIKNLALDAKRIIKLCSSPLIEE